VVLPAPPGSVRAPLDQPGALQGSQPLCQQCTRDAGQPSLQLAEPVAPGEQLAQDQRCPALGEHLGPQRDRAELVIALEREFPAANTGIYLPGGTISASAVAAGSHATAAGQSLPTERSTVQTTETLTRLRTRLIGEHDELLRQLRELGGEGDDGIDDPFAEEGFADTGQATAERVNLLMMVKSLRDILREVQAALERMDAGTYGICQRCGQPIAEERLEALPATRLCISCKRTR